MSQYWHAHWANESFKAHRLRNWEVTNWHPCWPERHCGSTVFECDNKGHILAGNTKSIHSPWGSFKGTWELPLKIDRKCAGKLSAFPEYKKNAWLAHKAKDRALCRGLRQSIPVRTKRVESDHESDTVVNFNNSDSELESELSEIKTTGKSPELACSVHQMSKV